jgi:hypothetical protein
MQRYRTPEQSLVDAMGRGLPKALKKPACCPRTTAFGADRY